MLLHLSRSTAVQLRVPIGILELEEVGERGWSADADVDDESPSILAGAGYGFSNCSLAGALFSSSL